ncbi:MAG: SAM-dependent methyltransferase [Steroidobacteraceae bacterium]
MPRDDVPIKHVSDTAFMVAVYRAMESERTDALYHDPLARKLAGEHGARIVASMSGRRTRMMVWTLGLRTRIIDELLLDCVTRGTQAILNLGAGLDTRPYRLPLAESLLWIEADYPHMIELKEERLEDERPRCRLERVKLDLADIAARAELFAQVSARCERVLVLTEGVIPYLSVDEVARLAQDLRAYGSFRHWIVDYFSPESMRYRKRNAIRRTMANAPFRFDPGDYFGFFEQHGWRPAQIRYLWDEAQALDRPMPLPWMARFWLALGVSQRRQEILRKLMAYVVLDPASGNDGAGSLVKD